MRNHKIVFIIAFFIFILAKLLWGSWLISIFLALSLISLYFLWKNKTTLNIILWSILIWLDLILIVFLIIPTKAYNIPVKNFYKQKENYLKIYVKDPPSRTKYMALFIWRKNELGEPERKMIKLSDYTWEKIKVCQNDKIYFVGRKTDKSYAAIFLWDWSIFRITPGTRLRLSKITKNLNNLANSQTKIDLEQWDLWFHIIKLIKDSNNMQIQTTTWQMLIIRWTAGLVSTYDKKTFAIDYSHYIEVKNKETSAILKEWQWAIITDTKIKIINGFQKILKYLWLNPDIINNFAKIDQKDIERYKTEILNYLKSKLWNNLILKLQETKLKLFSIWNKQYKQLLSKLEAYQYLLGENNSISSYLLNNPNLAFLSSNLQKQKAKLLYLYNQVKQNIQNSDLYKTYLINLKIAGKIHEISEQAIQKALEWKKYLENFLHLNESNR